MKRVANKDLNRDNWDDEDSPEERGSFNIADGEIIAKRKVLTVKRKESSNQSGVFKSFGGFSSQNTSQNFSLNIEKNDNREKHLNNLKHLNQTFLENITKYITENESCILSPLFDDYQRHILSIKLKYPLNIEESMSNFDTEPKVAISENNSTRNFSLFGGDKAKEDASNSVQSIFGRSLTQTNDESIVQSKTFGDFPCFNADKTKENTTIFSSSSFQSNNIFSTNETNGSALPTLFGVGGGTFQFKTQDNAVMKDDDEEYVPPKVESRDIKESDSVFDIRCKLFYLNDKDWKERGVGNLFIKPLTEGKCQLVMRADNTLGTILLNVLVTKDIPINVTKNNVSLVIMTDFAGAKSQSTSLLIRVKTLSNAEQLLSAIKNQVD